MTESRWNDVALAKLSNVVGKEHAEEVHSATLLALGLESLGSVDDLFSFAQRVKKLEGFVGAVGALLGVHAVMHGASSKLTGSEGPRAGHSAVKASGGSSD